MHNINNTIIKHISIPPLLKVIMQNLMNYLKKNKHIKPIEEDYDLMATLNAISCFFQKLYELQLEGIGKMDLIVIERIITDTCLTEFEIKIIMECFLKNLEKKGKKLDINELNTIFLNNILNINFMWHNMQRFLSRDLDYFHHILKTLCCNKEKADISKKITCLINNTYKGNPKFDLVSCVCFTNYFIELQK